MLFSASKDDWLLNTNIWKTILNRLRWFYDRIGVQALIVVFVRILCVLFDFGFFF